MTGTKSTLCKTTFTLLLLLLLLLPGLLHASIGGAVSAIKGLLLGRDSELLRKDLESRAQAEREGDLTALFTELTEVETPRPVVTFEAVTEGGPLLSSEFADEWNGSLASTTRKETCAFLAACCSLSIIFFVFLAILALFDIFHYI